MDVCQPHVRRRGFFLHSDTAGEPDTGEHENPEGLIVRVRIGRSAHRRRTASAARPEQLSGGRSRSSDTLLNEALPQFRSGTVTGSRQRASSHR